VILEGLEESVTESDIVHFLSYCGEVASVTFISATELGRSARALFVSPESVGIAELLNGAVVGASPVTITPETPGSPLHQPSTSSEDVVHNMEKDGKLAGGIVPAIRERARAVDAKLGIRSKVSFGVKAVGSVVSGAVSAVAGVVSGASNKAPTVQQWNSAPNQPQWGAPPANR
jgi:hypothetical protein